MSNPAPTLNQINAFNATIGTTIDFNIIGGTEVIRSNKIYIYDLSDNSLICTHLYVSTESIHELPPNTDSSIVYESGKSSADFTNNTQYYAQIQTFTDTNGTQGASGLSIAKLFWCLPTPTLTLGTIPTTISTTSYNVSATYTPNTSGGATNEIQEFQFNLYSAIGALLQTSGVVLYGEGVDLSYNFSGLEVDSTYYVALDVTTTQGMNVSAQSNTFTVSIDTPTMGSASVVNNGCDGYISVTSNLSSDYSHEYSVDAGEVMSFTTDSPNDIKELQVDFHPIQDGTPWMSQTPDTTPYLFRASPQLGHSYNNKIPTIVGGSFVWNQLVQNGNFAENSGWSSGGGTLTIANNKANVVKSGASNQYITLLLASSKQFTALANHHYLLRANIKSDNFIALFPNGSASGGVIPYASGYSNGKNIDYLWTPSEDTTVWFQIRCYTGYNLTADLSMDIQEVQCIDLTVYNSAIADHALTLEQGSAGAGIAWLKANCPQLFKYHAYSAPTMQSVEATAHKTYDADNNLLGNYPLGNVTLRGVPKVDANDNIYYDGDTYTADGTVTRVRSTYTFTGSETWTLYSNNFWYCDTNKTDAKNATKVLLTNGVIAEQQSNGLLRVYLSDNPSITASTNMQSLFAAGTVEEYTLATPTTETSDPFTTPMLCDPSGTEEWVTDNGVPVGQSTTYADIYPISGWTGATVEHTGFNQWDEVTESGYINANGAMGTNANSLRSKNFCPCVPNATYYFRKPSTYAQTPNICWYDENKTFISRSPSTPFPLITSPNNAHYFKLSMWAYGATYNHDICINFSDPAKNGTYEPYQGATYDVSWQTEAGTVYGGTVDVVSGVLTVTGASVDMGTLTWTYSETTQKFATTITDKIKRYLADVGSKKVLCSALETIEAKSSVNVTVANGVIFELAQSSGTNIICATDSAYTDGASFKTAMTGQTIVYELATPQTYQLTPHQIQTLVGQNNLWHDTNGEMTIMYQLPITDLLVKRKDVSQVGSQWLTLHSVPVEQASDMDFTYIDFLNQYGKKYQYALVPVLAQDQSGVIVQIEGGYTTSDTIDSIFDGVYIADQTNVERVKAGVGYGNVDMNQNIGTIVPIGSKYPVVITNSQNQYHNGSIRGKIVPNDFYSNGNLSRIDMVNKRDELEQFLTNKRAKIIKDWNGKIWLVMILSNINCTFDDNYGMGMVEFSADWVEIGDPTTQQDLYNAGLINVGGV